MEACRSIIEPNCSTMARDLSTMWLAFRPRNRKKQHKTSENLFLKNPYYHKMIYLIILFTSNNLLKSNEYHLTNAMFHVVMKPKNG